MTISEELLLAFSDGELTGAERAKVERALAAHPELRAKIDEQQRLRATLSSHYGPVAQEEVPEKMLAMLGASKAEGVSFLGAAREKKRTSSRRRISYGAIAASLAVGVLVGQLIPRSASGPLAAESGALLAQGDLASALETQLASAQTADDETRIGLTFADREGRVCRTFEGSTLSGLACRADDRWQVLFATSPEKKSSQFRQAASPAVLEAAQEIMATPPLDAASEREAMAAGWKIPTTAD